MSAALVGAFASGYVAQLAVGWYHVPTREGAAGYFIGAVGLGGLAVGAIAGLAACAWVSRGHPGGLPAALGLAWAGTLLLVGLAAGIARLLADVPPELDGQPLMVAIEVRYLDAQAPSPAGDPESGYVALHSVPRLSRTVRASVRGPLWKEDARRVDGQWVFPGAVQIFTGRGRRLLEIHTGDAPDRVALAELRWSAQRRLGWSDWIDAGRPGPRPHAFSFRYRVQPSGEPVRSERIGSFTVETIATSFREVPGGGGTVFASDATFRISHRARPVSLGPPGTNVVAAIDAVAAVVAVDGTATALVVHAGNARQETCHVLFEEAGQLRQHVIDSCSASAMAAAELTSDPVAFDAARHRLAVHGRIDRLTFHRPGLFLLGSVVLDTRRNAIHRFDASPVALPLSSVPPLAVAPDERSFAAFAYAGGAPEQPALLVTDFIANRPYMLRIDPVRMRFSRLEDLGPEWVDHHFEWVPGPDGVLQLRERANFIPLPYRGVLETDTGGHATYRLRNAGEPVRKALVDVLVAGFAAQPLPVEAGACEQRVRIGDTTVVVACSEDFRFVALSLAPGTRAPGLVADIARRFDAELATGHYDALFRR